MIAIIVGFRVKPEERQTVVDAIVDDATSALRDESGCLGFNVYADRGDPNVIMLHEVYRNDAALVEHRASPHLARLRDALSGLDVEVVGRWEGDSIFPADKN
jgi:quinol monooxygenase YgiN